MRFFLVLSGYGPLGRNQDNKKTKDLLRLRRTNPSRRLAYSRFQIDRTAFGVLISFCLSQAGGGKSDWAFLLSRPKRA